MSEHFTSLTLDIKSGVVSVEDTTEIWETVKEVAMEKVRRNKNRTSGGDCDGCGGGREVLLT